MEDDYEQSVPDEELRDPVKPFDCKPTRSILAIPWICVKGFCYFLGSIVIYLLYLLTILNGFAMSWCKLAGVDTSRMSRWTWRPLDWSAGIRYTIGVVVILVSAYILSQLGIDGVRALFA